MRNKVGFANPNAENDIVIIAMKHIIDIELNVKRLIRKIFIIY